MTNFGKQYTTRRPLPSGELAAFWEHGYVKLGRVAPPETIAALQGRVDEIMLGDVAYPRMTFMLCALPRLPHHHNPLLGA